MRHYVIQVPGSYVCFADRRPELETAQNGTPPAIGEPLQRSGNSCSAVEIILVAGWGAAGSGKLHPVRGSPSHPSCWRAVTLAPGRDYPCHRVIHAVLDWT